jgi:hypothetical protein
MHHVSQCPIIHLLKQQSWPELNVYIINLFFFNNSQGKFISHFCSTLQLPINLTKLAGCLYTFDIALPCATPSFAVNEEVY